MNRKRFPFWVTGPTWTFAVLLVVVAGAVGLLWHLGLHPGVLASLWAVGLAAFPVLLFGAQDWRSR